MKISGPLVKALNNQIAMEANAANAYLSAASWCDITGYDGAAKFFHSQAQEEHQHMLKFVNFVNGQCMSAIIPGVKQPPKTYKSLEAICKIALSNEQGVTKAINHMVDLATKDKDHNTITFLQFFVNEQITACISKWKKFNDSSTPTQAKMGGNYLNSILATQDAKKRKFDEAILLDKNNKVSEAPGENIFIVKNNTLITPPLSSSALDGITRKSILEFAKIIKIKTKIRLVLI